MFKLGVDAGGTFTDFVLFNEDTGELFFTKVPSDPEHPDRPVTEGMKELFGEHRINPKEVGHYVNGSTLATNTVIELKGAKTALLTTEGFKDILNIGRLRLPNPYNYTIERTIPLVTRRYVIEVKERMTAFGEEYKAIDFEALEPELRFLDREGIEAIAIGFINACYNPAHEQRVKEFIEVLFPGRFYVCTSSELWPEMREYERILIAVMNAYISKKMIEYVEKIEKATKDMGLGCSFLTSRSDGGVMTAITSSHLPFQTLLSGPAAGVMGSFFLARQAGYDKVISMDMGGTSCDISIIDAEMPYSTQNRVGEFMVMTPAVDISAIGAGGGSIAWTDVLGGVLKVGPRSVGAVPGPACYGLGGTEPTVTDAFVVTGIVDPTRFLGGKIKLQSLLAEQAIMKVGKVLKLDVRSTGRSILQSVTANMYDKLLTLMAKRGLDLRDFVLYPYGGAGPTQACLVAREANIKTVIVPPTPGVFSALGGIVGDVKNTFISSVRQTIEEGGDEKVIVAISDAFRRLKKEALAWFSAENISVISKRIVYIADMRYRGQSFETHVIIPQDVVENNRIKDIANLFHMEYERLYGLSQRHVPIEVISVRTEITGTTAKPPLRKLAKRKKGKIEPTGLRKIFIEEETMEAAIYAREDLTFGDEFAGPAIVEQFDTTTLVTREFSCMVDEWGNLVLSAN